MNVLVKTGEVCDGAGVVGEHSTGLGSESRRAGSGVINDIGNRPWRLPCLTTVHHWLTEKHDKPHNVTNLPFVFVMAQ